MLLGSLRSLGMKIKAYIDTNIFIYAILHHPVFGNICSRILRDMKKRVYEPCGSLMVALELLGSLSKIDPSVARRATELYLALDMTLIPLNVEILNLASIINETTNIKYDAVHAAVMMLNDIPVIITNDVDDWLRLSRSYQQLLNRIISEGYQVNFNRIDVITPQDYTKWYEGLKNNLRYRCDK